MRLAYTLRKAISRRRELSSGERQLVDDKGCHLNKANRLQDATAGLLEAASCALDRFRKAMYSRTWAWALGWRGRGE